MVRDLEPAIVPGVRVLRTRMLMGELGGAVGTGVGKTQLITQILRQIRECGDSAIVYDPACECLQRFYGTERRAIGRRLEAARLDQTSEFLERAATLLQREEVHVRASEAI